MKVEERVKKILTEQLSYPFTKEQIDDSTSLYGKGLGLDSVDLLSLVVRLEEEFGIFFDPAEVVAALKNVPSLMKMIELKVNHVET